MFFEDILEALVTLLRQPIAVAALVLLVGIHAALWLLVFERAGFPTALAPLLLLPPLTLLLPLYVALARWPSQPLPRFARRELLVRAPSAPRRVTRPPGPERVPGEFHSHLPLRLRADGLPVGRIPLVPAPVPASWPGAQDLTAQDLYRGVVGQFGP